MKVLSHDPSIMVRGGHSAWLALAVSVSFVGAPAAADDLTHDGRDVEQVIVTAQRRAEALQDVPISISVLGGDELDSSTTDGVMEALNRVPGVAITTGAQTAASQIAVRGVTAGGPLFSGSSPIAYYIDSVPFGLVKTAIAPDTSAYDLQQVEVLRGPQGTLYGANAQNGVMRVLTKDPDAEEFQLKVRTLGSSTEDGGENYRGDMAVNVPIVDGKVAARAVVGYQNLSGWIDRPNREDANDAELRNMRLKVKAQPTDALSVGVSAWLSRQDYGAPSLSDDDRRHPSVYDESIKSDYDAYGFKVVYDFGNVVLTSMTSYLEFENAGERDLSPINFPRALFTGLDAQTLSEEITLTSNTDGVWHWSAGAFYRDGEDRLRQNNLGPGAPFDYTNGSESYAVFGELSRRFWRDQLQWTLGLRYFHDDVFVRENINQGPAGSVPQNNQGSFHSTSPRAVLTWYPADELTVYASYSEGFRSGFDQDPGVKRSNPGFPPLKPDTLHNYEIGTKWNGLNGSVAFETAVYFIDWKDVQQTLGVPFGGTIVTALVNGQSASGFGADIGLTVSLLDSIELGLTGSWNDLQMDTPVFSSGVQLFGEGDRLNYSPEYTVGASADYAFPFGSSGFEGHFSASANYTSEQTFRTISVGRLRTVTGDNMLVSRVSFTVDAPERWSASLFADNLNDEDGTTVGSTQSPVWSPRLRPRTVGLQLDYRF